MGCLLQGVITAALLPLQGGQIGAGLLHLNFFSLFSFFLFAGSRRTEQSVSAAWLPLVVAWAVSGPFPQGEYAACYQVLADGKLLYTITCDP